MTAPVSPIDALLAELVPTRPDPAVSRGPWTEAEQDAHWAQLCEAVGTPGAPRPTCRQQAA
jgi:hypothetical protein